MSEMFSFKKIKNTLSLVVVSLFVRCHIGITLVGNTHGCRDFLVCHVGLCGTFVSWGFPSLYTMDSSARGYLLVYIYIYI